MRDSLPLSRSAAPACLAFLACLLPGAPARADSPAPPSREEVLSSFEYDLPGELGGANPFDPDEASLRAVFTGPDGSRASVDGFWTQDYAKPRPGAPGGLGGRLGKPHWKIRFCPELPGVYSFEAELRLRGRLADSSSGSFEAVASARAGFVRTDPRNPHYLALSTGGSFFPLGLSVAWVEPGKTIPEYERYFRAIGEAGGDMTRVWLCEWNLPLEGPRAGSYRLDSATLLDAVLDAAARRGLRVILTLGSYGELMSEAGPWNEQGWSRHPYNRANGGPCASGPDTFSDPEARRLYRNRLRYVAARWASRPELLAVELYNEVNLPPDWAEEMVAAFRERDPYGHLVTASVGWPWGEAYDAAPLWEVEGLAPATEHYYGFGDPGRNGEPGEDLAAHVRASSLAAAARYEKPFFFEEIGLDPSKDDALYDTPGSGAQLHEAYWSAAVSLSAAAPLSHWKEYFDKAGLYRELRPLRRFVDAVDWGAGSWRAFEAEADIPGAGGPEARAAGKARLFAIASERVVVGWIQDRRSSWRRALSGLWRGEATRELSLPIAGAGLGPWAVEWLDTRTGEAASGEPPSEGILRVPPFTGDIAFILTRLPE